MTALVASGSSEAAVALVELGAVVLALAILARLAGLAGITAVPLYLLAGLATGEGGIVSLDVSEDFISLGADIGVLLLLLTLGLEYTERELREGLRTGVAPGLIDMALNAVPGLLAGLLLGWEPLGAVLLGGVTWVSSSGIVAKVLDDLGRLGYRETPSVLNLLVIEDVAMAVYLPVVAALVAGGAILTTVGNVTVAVVAVAVILSVAVHFGGHLSRLLAGGSDESLLLAVFGLTLFVAGLAQLVEVSGAIAAFLVGIAVSGPVQARAADLVAPLRDLFAATFFLFFSFQLDPAELVDAIVPAALLVIVTTATKILTGWYVAGRTGVGPKGRLRAGTVLVARGEFSIVIAALGAELLDGPELGAVAATYVLLTAVVGPLLSKYADRIPLGAPAPPAPRATG